MNCKNLRSHLYASAAFSLGMVASAFAQTTGGTSAGTQSAQNDTEIQQIEQVTVTARRTTERLQDVPISITVFNQQQLLDNNVVNAGDLAAVTPSLSVNNNFGNQNTSFAIRGFVQDTGTAPSVGVFFADVMEPRGANNGLPTGDGAGPGDFFDLQNVQVLKGPQGTLFGRNTTGGDILLVPQKPTDELGGYLQASYGNYNMQEVQGVLNVPISDHVRLRVAADEMTREGYLDNTSGIGPRHFDNVDYYALRASLDVDVTSNLENYTIASYTKSDTHGDVQKMIACDPTDSLSPFTYSLLPVSGCSQMAKQPGYYDVQQSLTDPKNYTDTWRVINTTTWTVSDDLTIKNIASYSQFSDYYDSPIFGTNFSTSAIPANTFFAGQPAIPSYPFGFASAVPIQGGLTANEQTYSEEFQLQGRGLDNRLTWQAGLYMDASDPLSVVGNQGAGVGYCTSVPALECFDPVAEIYSGFGAPAPLGFPPGVINVMSVSPTGGVTSYRDQAVYAQGTYKLNDQFKLTEGIRFTQDTENNTSAQYIYTDFPWPNSGLPAFTPMTPTPNNYGSVTCTNPAAALPGCTLHLEQHSKAPTWLIDLDYTPDEDVLAYIKYSRGYRAGAINPNISAPYQFTQPETVNTYELGAKTSWEGAISGILDGDIFYNDFSNQQLQVGFNKNPEYACATLTPPTGCIPAPVSATAAPLNAGKSRILGLELESTISPYEGLTFHVGYTYLNTDLLSVKTYATVPGGTYASPSAAFFQPSGLQKVGDELELSPRDKVTLTAAYTLPIDPSFGKITPSLTFTHTDPMITNYSDNTLTSAASGYGGNGAIFSGLNKTKATDLLNLDLNWEGVAGQPIDLSFFATNVTGQKYYTFAAGLAQGTGFETAELGQPTMYGVRLRYTFGG